MSKESFVTLEKVELTESATTLSFNVRLRPGFIFTIPKYTYIQPLGGKKLVVKGAKGILIGEQFAMPKNGETRYQLIFPPIDKNTDRIDFSEGTGSGAWFIYDIHLKKELKTHRVPEEIYGKWRNLNTGALELCLFDTVAVYKNKVWQYKKIKYRGKKGTLVLLANGEEQMLYVFNTMDGLLVGEEKEKVDLLTRKRSIYASDDKAFTSPILSTDSAVYSGYLYKYNPRCGVKTLTLLVNNVIAGGQKEYPVAIHENGYFSVKIPLYYPHQVYMKCSFFMTTTLFLEPGKELFHVISFEYPRKKTHEYMGELASVNNELEKIKSFSTFPSSKARKKVLGMTGHEYVAFVKKYWTTDVQKLDESLESGNVSEKVYQVKKMSLDYEYAQKILSYSSWYSSAYRRKHKISRSTRNLDIKIDSIPMADLSFITNEFVNSDLALVSNEYSFFVNRFKYSDVLKIKASRIGFAIGIPEYLEDNPQLSVMDKKIITMLELHDSVSKLPQNMAYNKQYRSSLVAFYTNYKAIFTLLRDSLEQQPTLGDVEYYLVQQGEELSSKEKELLKAYKENMKLEANQQVKLLADDIPNDSITAFYKKLKPYRDYRKIKRKLQIEKLAENLEIEPGLLTDIMFSQDVCRKMVDQLTPLSNSELDAKLEEIKTPFIASYLTRSNDETLATIAYRKTHSIANKHEVPNVENEKLFDAIMKPYSGKVVYVDFWATWCAPCRSGIQHIAPLKDTMKDDNVVFVYITGESSPVNTWENMIPDIKGEHYRVSKEQWKYLCDTFKVTGIPHYMLVDKTGKIVDEHLPRLRNSEIKEILEQEIAK